MKRKVNVNKIKLSKLILVFILLFFIVVAVRLSYLAISPSIDGINMKNFVSSRNTRKKTIYAKRGTIYDVTGETLARTVNSYTVIAFLDESRSEGFKTPQHVVDKELTAQKLSPLLGMSEEAILYLLNRNAYQVELGPGGRDISELKKEQIEELKLPGISFMSSYKRYYPKDETASYILGYVRTTDEGELIGEMGIESYYNNMLKGEDGYTIYQQDVYGYKIPNTNEETKDSVDGVDIYLTLDSNIQYFVEKYSKEAYEEYNPNWLFTVVADAKTGAILGSTSYPTFNPNIKNITNYLNPLVSFSFEPGSTMKTFTYMAAMEKGVYDGNTKYESGSIEFGKDTIYDWNNKGFGEITYDEGFLYSSNVAISYMTKEYFTADELREYFKKFGFGKKTGIELPGELSGTLNFTYPVEIANAGFGQGITITPIQMIQAMTTIANDGVMLKPYIVDKIVDPNTNKVMYQGGREEIRKVASTETIKKIQDMMHNVVYSNLTDAKNYKPTAVEMIGKTGTAQIANPNGRGYLTGSNDYIRSFSGLFPYNDPQYIVYISVKQFSGNFKKVSQAVVNVVDEIVKYKNIVSTVEENKEQSIIVLESYLNTDVLSTEEKLKALGLNPVVIGDGKYVVNQYPNKKSHVLKGSKVFLKTESQNITMPDVTNWSENEITTFCNFIGLKYTLNGSGHVTSISIPAGSVIDLSTIVEINLTK